MLGIPAMAILSSTIMGCWEYSGIYGIEEVGWAEPATMRTTGVSSINCRAVLRVFWRQHVLCVYTYIYNPPASFPYRIGTPRCCINRFFLYRSPLNFSCPVCLFLAGSNFISKLRVLLLYFFSVLKFSDLGLQFYSRLQFYRDMCRFCMVLFSCQF